jgi:septal ring factor EnvC (AmiA/AmiB activator)
MFVFAATAEAAQRSSKAKKNTASPKTELRSAKSVKQDKQRTQQEIAETQKKIKDNERQTQKKLDELNHIGSQIERQQTAIVALSTRLDSLDVAISRCNDSIASLEKSAEALKSGLKSTLRNMRTRRQQVNSVGFVFAAKSFHTAIKRVGYLNELNAWRTRKIRAVQRNINKQNDQRKKLESLKGKQASTMAQLSNAKQALVTKQSE